MTRAILIIGPQGSGSSAIAGAMQSLGINMGIELKGPSNLNPKGHFECLVFERLALKWSDQKQIDKDIQEDFKEYVLKRNCEGLWGLKMPLMIDFVPFVIPHVDSCKIISIDRPFEGCVKSSMIKYPGKSREFIENIHCIIRQKREELIERYDLPSLHVDYNNLTSNTKEIMNKVVDFCYEDFPRPTEESIEKAIHFVDPSMNHRREEL